MLAKKRKSLMQGIKTDVQGEGVSEKKPVWKSLDQ